MTALRAPALEVPVRPLLRVVTETDLFRAYAPPLIRVEPCACGTDVEQLLGDDVMSAVIRHNATVRHEAWSAQTRLVP